MRKNSSRENRSLFPSRNFKRQTKGGGGGREIFIQEKVKKDRSCSRSRTNFLRKFLPSIVVVVHWIGHHRQRSLCSPYFSFLRDHANEGSIKRGCTAIIIISTNIKWTFTRSKELGFSKGYFRSIRYHLQFLFAQLC